MIYGEHIIKSENLDLSFKDQTAILYNSVKYEGNLSKLNADRIELFTGPYAKEFPNDRYRAIEQYVKCSEVANDIDIEINAGHDLNQNNLKFFCQSVKNTKEVSIGHALVTESLYNGLESTIKSYLQILK